MFVALLVTDTQYVRPRHHLPALCLLIGLSACGADLNVVRDEASPTTSSAAPERTTSSISREPLNPVELAEIAEENARLPELMPIFSLVGETDDSLEAIGHDSDTERYVVYTKVGQGLPAVAIADEAPEMRPNLDLVDDGRGRNAEGSHMTVGNGLGSLDIYWSSHGITEVRSVATGADALLGRAATQVYGAFGGRVIFGDAGSGADPNRTRVLRSHSSDVDGRFNEDWSVELSGNILTAVPVRWPAVLVATTAADDPLGTTIGHLYFVQDGRVSRSIQAPPGLVWIQTPSVDLSRPAMCSNTHTLGSIEWDLDTTNHLLTACQDDVPISTTSWCCGMGELFGAMDSNDDGIAEVFVGGTSVGGGGGGMYSLVDGELRPIQKESGEDLVLLTGDVGARFAVYGCVDGFFVQVVIEADDTTAWARRTFYRIDGHVAEVVDEQRIEWTLDEPVVEQGLGGAIWDVYESAPVETVNDLLSCAIPDKYDLAGTDGLGVHVAPKPLSIATSCEVVWPRPYTPVILTLADGTTQTWGAVGDEVYGLIDSDDFVSTADGRFVWLDWFPCSHESEIKTIFAGRYDTSTGALLEWERVEPPEDFVSSDTYYRRHPDRLVVNEAGDIVGELDTALGIRELILSQS